MSSGAHRLTLVQRQQKLLEDRGFSKPSASFAQRQDAHLQRTGRMNAIASSRKKAELLSVENDNEERWDDDTAPQCSTRASRMRHLLHPSMVGSLMSEACHPETIGAGDDTKYWDFQHRVVEKHDLGHAAVGVGCPSRPLATRSRSDVGHAFRCDITRRASPVSPTHGRSALRRTMLGGMPAQLDAAPGAKLAQNADLAALRGRRSLVADDYCRVTAGATARRAWD